jgi:hypothetical protein
MPDQEPFIPNVSLGGKLPKQKGPGDSGPMRQDNRGDQDSSFSNRKTSSKN